MLKMDTEEGPTKACTAVAYPIKIGKLRSCGTSLYLELKNVCLMLTFSNTTLLVLVGIFSLKLPTSRAGRPRQITNSNNSPAGKMNRFYILQQQHPAGLPTKQRTQAIIVGGMAHAVADADNKPSSYHWKTHNSQMILLYSGSASIIRPD